MAWKNYCSSKALKIWDSLEVDNYLYFDLALSNDSIQDSFALVTSPVKYSIEYNNFDFIEEKKLSTKRIINRLHNLNYVSKEHRKELSEWIEPEHNHMRTWMDFKLVIDDECEYFKAYLGIQPLKF